MPLTRAAVQYLEQLRRVTADLAGNQRLDDVLAAITRGLRHTGRVAGAGVQLYLTDEECPVCRRDPPPVPSLDRRLHIVAVDLERPIEVPAIMHATELGAATPGRAAQERRTMLVRDLPGEERRSDPRNRTSAAAREAAEFFEREGLAAGAFFPLFVDSTLLGVVSAFAHAPIGPEEAAYLEVFALQAGTLIHNAQLFDELEALKERLSQENAYLDVAVREEAGFDAIIGQSRALRRVLAMVRRVAPTDTTVLLTGETGTGKELIARAIHDASPRAGHPMIKVNCGAIPAGLAESEFFGHERGAFTGAQQRRIGYFELADRGTIFLDEVGELPPDMQVKLLRVLQEHELKRVGGEQSIRVDVRVLAATSRDLAADVRAGRFRSDLYYRLNVLHIHVPPLRERREDIPALASHLATLASRRLRREAVGLSAASLDRLVQYDWPGNIRELQNVIERACVLSPGPMIEIPDPSEGALIPAPEPEAEAPLNLAAAERQLLLRALARAGWRIEGRGGAAELLGLKPSTLRWRMRKLGITRPLD